MIRLRKGAGTAGIALLATLIVLEVTLRAFGPYLPGIYRTGSFIEPDPELGWRHVRGAEVWIRSKDFVAHVVFNDQGRRGPFVPPSPEAGVRRILLIGDSFAEAVQVDLTDAFETKLGPLLGAGRPVEIVNDAVSGYGTDQEVLSFERSGRALHPDTVLLVFSVANDVWNNDPTFESIHPTAAKPHFALDGRDTARVVPPAEDVRGLADGMRLLLARSAALATLKSGLIPDAVGPDFLRMQLGVLAAPSGEWDQAWELTELILARFKASIQGASMRAAIVVVPEACQVHDDMCAGTPSLGSSNLPQIRLAATCARLGISIIDLLPEFRAHASEGERLYFEHDRHWNVTGQEIAARAVAASLR